MAERDWTIATDLSARLVELRDLLDEPPAQFTRRFGRGRKQFYQWREGKQLPGRSVLEAAAEKNGWPRTIFEEGGKRPNDAIKGVVKGLGQESPTTVREGVRLAYGAPGADSAADRVQALAGRIILERLVSRKNVAVDEVIGYLAALADAAAGRPVRLPTDGETTTALAKDAGDSVRRVAEVDASRGALVEPADPTEKPKEPPLAG
jgi:hypothetical protein